MCGRDSPQQSDIQVTRLETLEAPPPITIEGLMIHVVNKNGTLEPAISCDYFKHRPAIQILIGTLIRQPLDKTSYIYIDKVRTHRIHKATAQLIQKIIDTVDIQSYEIDMERTKHSQEDFIVAIKTQFPSYHAIRAIKSLENQARLDECFGEATHRLLRAIALHQGPSRRILDTNKLRQLGLAIDDVDRVLSKYLTTKAQWSGFHPNKLFSIAKKFHRLDEMDRCLFYANWRLWEGQPMETLAVLNCGRQILKGQIYPHEVRARYEIGDVIEARELRDKCAEIPQFMSAVFDLFEFATQEGDQKRSARELLRRAISDHERATTMQNRYLSYAIKGCFLYFEAISATKDNSKKLMSQSIKSWEQALESTKSNPSKNSINGFIAKLSVCALKFKHQSEDAEVKFNDLSVTKQADIIYYYLYIYKEWVDTMYMVLQEHGKHEYVEQRPQRIEAVDRCGQSKKVEK
ncbi:hypothetical protein FHETE_1371 [Fusarium heterosporum]|uniref:Uncharacterized protein n=1 Tax=Fusarium heterosporum TaxID=42747 RepID=A0A8H5TXQ6_FUSHE|nr:hypothetical protein FHETE_1371 [Fusarium heterosporum]